MAGPSQNIELEAAKFLHKLIQDSKDEPAKLATKLFVILQHMKSSGKESTMPFQVISRAMETVINQHGLDIEALKSSRLPMPSGVQGADSATSQFRGPSPPAGVAKDSNAGLPENEIPKMDPFSSSKPTVGPGPTGAGHEYFQGPGSQHNSQTFDHESPSSLDSRSGNSQSQEIRETTNRGKQINQKEGKKNATKRKRGNTSEPPSDNAQQSEPRNTRKGKINKVDVSSGSAIKAGEHGNFNVHLSSNPMEQFASMSGSNRPTLRPKQESQHLVEKQVEPASSTMPRGSNIKLPEGSEVNSTHSQQMPSVSHENMGLWNQNKSGLQFEKPQVPRFSSNVAPGPGNADTMLLPAAPSPGTGSFGMVHGSVPIASSGSFPTADPGFGNAMQFGGSNLTAGKGLEHDGGASNRLTDSGKRAMAGRQNSASEMSMLRNAAPRDTGKSPVGSGQPFREQQLKQLRAQCLVFLAFRNGLIPKKMHLDIALGSVFPKEVGSADGLHKELVDQKGKVPFSSDPNIARETDKSHPGTSSTGRFQDADSLPKEADDKEGLPSEERKQFQMLRKPDVELQTQHDSSRARNSLAVGAPGEKMENGHPQGGRIHHGVSMMGPGSWNAPGNNHDEISRAILQASSNQQNMVPEGKDNAGQVQSFSNMGNLGNSHPDNNFPALAIRDRWKPVSGVDNNHHGLGPFRDANTMTKHVHQDQREEDNFMPIELSASPKYTMSEKWILDHQQKKHLKDQKWLMKQQKTRHRIATCFYKLKENANSSEDISAKTKSVIELKKLQLLELQRRLRSDFLNDFFKPIYVEVDRLKSCKKHKHGRRVKQLEKFEQKMKEERQKRIRERQKEFFSEIEVHKERLDDVFKFKRERLKGFNKYAKEFHKKKERIHREKIDRIQREKINLLKINDVEGYLRMVQDAKSDRVKQLLKETEKYLQKLGSKLQQAKTTRCEGDESGSASLVDKSETAVENEDESDQAKHYLESNEKYYLMAHSVKESISDQPNTLQGGTLREYQMNGLRWLVSLYNNHLNGILADEMGLGKTVQVISLICYLMEAKNDRGPFLVVVPSSVLPGWASEIEFWAPTINKIVYSGPPEERRKLFKERIVHQKFNVLLTTYEYLMNKHDRPKLSKIHWHYVIIDEGHRIKNASCKLNADLKYYQSSHRLLLTGTPLQNNLEELWALLNFLLPNIFNSSEDFSQWFNKPFESNGDNSADQALLSEEENLLIINRLHQVLRPFVLRRLKHKVENELPEKIERLIRCEASAYQKLLMKRVEDNLGAIGSTKSRSVHNSVMELRNICNHPYLSQLHADQVDNYLPKHYLPPIIRHCGKLEMLDRLLPKLKAADHRILFFSTMTRLLDVMEEYLHWKQYRYLRLDGHTSGGDRGALIDAFNKPDSPYFIFLLSIRAGGVGVNLQAADTVIIFDTDWNPQVDLQAQARAHRIGQKRDVLVLRFETVQTVEEQVRASAEHKLGVANQSITAGFFDNNTSAEDRREYLEALLRECKKEEAAPVLDDDALNDILARSGSEIDVFESVDQQRREAEVATWRKLACAPGTSNFETPVLLPPRLVTEDDLKEFVEAMKIYDVPKATEPPSLGGVKRKGASLGGADTQHYGRGKRTREVRSYEEQWTEEEFEKLCQAESPDSPSKSKEEVDDTTLPSTDSSEAVTAVVKTELPIPPVLPPPAVTSPPTTLTSPPVNLTPPAHTVTSPPATATVAAPPAAMAALPATVTSPPAMLSPPTVQPQVMQPSSIVTPPPKRGRGRPKRVVAQLQAPVTAITDTASPGGTPSSQTVTNPDLIAAAPPGFASVAQVPMPPQGRGQGRKSQSGAEAPRRRGKRQVAVYTLGTGGVVIPDPKPDDVTQNVPVVSPVNQAPGVTVPAASVPAAQGSSASVVTSGTDLQPVVGAMVNSPPVIQPVSSSPAPPLQTKGQSRKPQTGGSGSRRRGRKQALVSAPLPLVSAADELKQTPETEHKAEDSSQGKTATSKQENALSEVAVRLPGDVAGLNVKTAEQTVDLAQGKQSGSSLGPALGESQSADIIKVVSVSKETLPENSSLPKPDTSGVSSVATLLDKTVPEVCKNQHLEDKSLPVSSPLPVAAPTPTSPAVLTASPVSQPAPYPAGHIAPPVSQSTPPAGPPGRRSGRKTPVRTETPRRRGRRSASALPITPDNTSAIPDPRLISQSPSGSAVTLGAASHHLNAVYDPKKKDQSSLTSQTKQPTNSPATIDSAKGRIQTADVSDVARVMKEMFSGTRSLRSKTAELTGKEGKGAPSISLSRPSAPEVAKNPIVEEKVHSGAANMDMGAPGFPLKYGKQSPTAVSNETLVKQDETANPEIKTSSVSDKKIDPIQTSQEDLTGEDSMKPVRGQTSEPESTTVDSVEASCAAPLVGENRAAISQLQPLAADPCFSSATSMELDVKPNDSENKTEPLAKDKAEKDDDSCGAIESHVRDFSNHGGPHISNEHDLVSSTDNSGPQILLASALPSVDSEAVKSTSETIITGPEPLSKTEDLVVGPESAVANSQDSSLHDASSSGRNQDHDITKDHVSSMLVDQIEGDRQKLLVNSDAGGSSSLMADGEKCDALESSAVPEEPKGSLADSDDKLDVPTTSDCFKNTSEKALPVEEEQNIDDAKEKDVIFGLSPLEPSKSSDADTVIFPGKALEPSSLLLTETENATSSSLPSEARKDSEVDMDIQLESSGQPISLENSEVEMPAPLDSSSLSVEKVECPSQTDKIQSRDSPQDLASAFERIPDGDSVSDEAKPGLLLSELTGEEKIISPGEQDLPDERKENKAEEDDQPMDSETSDHNIIKTDSSEVGGVLLETVTSGITSIQPSSSALVAEIVEGVTVKGTEEPAEREIIADAFDDRDCPETKDSKTLDLPRSSLVPEEESIDGSVKTVSDDLPVQLEVSKDVETEKEIITDALNAQDCPENKDSQLLDLPSSSVSEEAKIEVSTVKSVVSFTEPLNDLISGNEVTNQTDESLNPEISPRDTIDSAVLSSSPSVEARVTEEESKVTEAEVSDQVQVCSVSTDTEKQEAASTESPGGSKAGQEEGKLPEADCSDPMDVCEALEVVEKHEADDSDPMDACEAVVVVENHGADDELKMDESQSNETVKEIVDERSSRQEIEEIKGSSDRNPAGSPVLDKVELPLLAEKNDELESSSEKLQADCPVAMEVDFPLSLEKPEEIRCTPEKLQASSSVSENVDLPSSSQKNEEMESEKHRSSSPVSEKVDMPLSLEKNEDEKPQSDKLDLPSSVEEIEDEKVQSEKVDLVLLEKNEIEGSSEKLQPSSPVSEKVVMAVSSQITKEIVGKSEEHESGNVDLPSSSEKNEEIDGKSETEQSVKLDLPLPLEKTEEVEDTSKKEESEKVDLPLEKTEEIECTSEKEESEKVDLPLEKTEEIECTSEKEESEKVDLPSEKTEEIECTSEKEESEKVDCPLESTENIEGISEKDLSGKVDLPLPSEKTEEMEGTSEEDRSEKVNLPVPLEKTAEMEGMSEEGRSEKVDLALPLEKTAEMEGTSEEDRSEKVDMPLQLEKTEEIEGTSENDRLEKVDLPLPLEKTEEIEGISEKVQSEQVDATLSLEQTEEIGPSEKHQSDDLPLSPEKTDETEKVDTSVSLEKTKENESTSEKADTPLSLEKTEETAGSSEKKQEASSSVAVEMTVSDERDTSEVTQVLPDSDASASSDAMEDATSDKNADPTGNLTGKDNLSGDVALEGGPADESDASKVLDPTMDALKSTLESSEAQAKAQEDSSPVDETAPECEKKDSPVASTEESDVSRDGK